MKKLVLISAIALISLLASAIEPDKTQYVILNGVTIACSNIKKGIIHTKIETLDGEHYKYDNTGLEAYYKNGFWFQKMNNVEEGNVTDNKIWMKLVACKKGLTVYQKESLGFSGEIVSELFIFEGNRFVCQINEENKGHLLPFLGLKEKK